MVVFALGLTGDIPGSDDHQRPSRQRRPAESTVKPTNPLPIRRSSALAPENCCPRFPLRHRPLWRPHFCRLLRASPLISIRRANRRSSTSECFDLAGSTAAASVAANSPSRCASSTWIFVDLSRPAQRSLSWASRNTTAAGSAAHCVRYRHSPRRLLATSPSRSARSGRHSSIFQRTRRFVLRQSNASLTYYSAMWI